MPALKKPHFVRLFTVPSTQNPRPKPHEKPASKPRKIRDLHLTKNLET